MNEKKKKKKNPKLNARTLVRVGKRKKGRERQRASETEKK